MKQEQTFKIGDRVKYNDSCPYVGTVVGFYASTNMVHIRFPGGIACVDQYDVVKV